MGDDLGVFGNEVHQVQFLTSSTEIFISNLLGCSDRLVDRRTPTAVRIPALLIGTVPRRFLVRMSFELHFTQR